MIKFIRGACITLALALMTMMPHDISAILGLHIRNQTNPP